MTPRGLVALALAVAVAAGGGYWAWSAYAPGDPFAQCRAGQPRLDPGTVGGPFELVSETGRTVTADGLLTSPALLYFGYTFCPDVCPLDVSRNADAVDLLDRAGHTVLPVFISVDPERDTPEVLADWTDYMHPRMIGLTGSPDQIAAAARAYKAFYLRQPAQDGYYLVDHSAFTYLVLPGLGTVDFFARSATADEIAARVACYIDAS